jgi:hypothetical protein
MRLLVTQSEARLAAEAEVRKQPEAEKPFSWTAEQDKMYQELSFLVESLSDTRRLITASADSNRSPIRAK